MNDTTTTSDRSDVTPTDSTSTSSTASSQLGSVAVCALTYLRPGGLTQLLAGLGALEPPDGVDVMTIIVDNDPEGSARETIAAAADAPQPLVYVCEQRRGISHGRNRAMSTALEAGADAVVFIDDDEIPATDWLKNLVDTQRATGADIVTGPVFPVFESPPPQWVVDGQFFERRRHRHHEWIRYATTSSVLIMRRCFDGHPEPFDPDFGLSGGSDTHLFAQLREAGFSIVWCDTAHVHETIPTSRVDRQVVAPTRVSAGADAELLAASTSSFDVEDRSTDRQRRPHVVRGVLRSITGVPRGTSGATRWRAARCCSGSACGRDSSVAAIRSTRRPTAADRSSIRTASEPRRHRRVTTHRRGRDRCRTR